MTEPQTGLNAPSASDKISIDRGQFLEDCSAGLDEWSDYDRGILLQFIVGPTGRKLMGSLNLLLPAQGNRSLAIDISAPDAVAQLANVQGMARGVAAAIDHILDFTQKEPANV